MPDTYRPGLRCVAIGNNGDPATATWTFLSRNEDSQYEPGITKEQRAYEDFSTYEVQEVVSAGRLPRITVNGDADNTELKLFARSVFGLPATSLYKAGGDLGSAVPQISARIFEGKTDGNTGSALNAYYQQLKAARCDRLRVFLQTPGGKWKFTAGVPGIFDAESSMLGSAISFNRSASKLFSQGGTIVQRNSVSRLLVSAAMEFMNAADPLFTTVLAAQANAGDWTSPTSLDEGAIGCTYDFTYLAADDVAASGGGSRGDYETNTARPWTINATNGSAQMLINLYLAQHLTFAIQKQGKRSPYQRVTGVCVFSPGDATGHAITLV